MTSDEGATSAPTPTPKYVRRVCYESLVAISVTYALVLTGVSCIAGVQSSLNSEKGLGTASLGVQTATMIVQALFFNAALISKLGLKTSMLVGIVLESIYVCGNTYPKWYTLIPAAAISGFGRPLIRTAEAIYITKLAGSYAEAFGSNVQSTKTKFFYVYYVFYCSARVFGNVASSLILGSGLSKFDLSKVGQPMISTGQNNSLMSTWNFDRDTKYCGAKYCDIGSPIKVITSNMTVTSTVVRVHSLVSKHPDMTKVYWLCGFSFACMAVAFFVNAVFLKSLSQTLKNFRDDSIDDMQTDDPEEEIITNPCDYLLNTVKYWQNPLLLLIMPLTIYNGIDNAFWSADFTKAYVTCYFGIHWVGFVVAWYGLTSPIAVFAVSWLNRPSLRPLPFLLAYAAHLGVCIVLLSWTPTISSLPTLFSLSAIWGVGSGLWPSILSALYGVVFADNLKAAFSNYWLGDSLGALLTYAWSNQLCTSVKIYIFMSVLSIGIVGYVLIELNLRVSKRHNLTLNETNGVSNAYANGKQKPNEKSCVLQKCQKLPNQ